MYKGSKAAGTSKFEDWADYDSDDNNYNDDAAGFYHDGDYARSTIAKPKDISPKRPVVVTVQQSRPRRFIKKFGDAAKEEGGVTYVGEAVEFELTRAKKKKEEETWVSLNDKGEKIFWGQSSASQDTSMFMQRLSQRTSQEPEPEDSPNVYVPPSRRSGEQRDFSLKVSNLSDSVTTEDIYDLFDKYGSIQRVHMVKRRGEFIGVAYVSYSRKESAVDAMHSLDGHRYDHLVLSVEWAPPRNN